MNTKRLVYIAIFTALIIVGGFITVPVPYSPTPLSFQTLFVIMAGLVLGGRDGAAAVLVYLVMGLFGLPVFTQGGGVGYVFKPSFGYLIGFPIGALVSGVLCSRIKRMTRGKVFLSALCGMVPIYIIGITYQVLIVYLYLGKTFAAAVAGVPAILVLAVKDAVLCGLTASVYPSLRRAVRRRPSTKAVKDPVS